MVRHPRFNMLVGESGFCQRNVYILLAMATSAPLPPLPEPEKRAARRSASRVVGAPPPSGSEMSKIVLALIAAAASVSTAFITAYYTAHNAAAATVESATANQNHIIEQNQQHTNAQIDRLAGTTAGPLSDGQKLCRVLQGHTWRDGVIVPKDWSVSLCQDYQKKTGGTGYQLGCIYSDGTTLGGENGTFPSPNCGWR
jgi:hypothetical protein